MALKEINKTLDEGKVVEIYSTGFMYGRCTPSQVRTIEEHGDFVTAVSSKLEDYCSFSGGRPSTGRRGGPVMNGHWSAVIDTIQNGSIEIKVLQEYSDNRNVTQADVKISYFPEVLKKDVAVVRKAITSSGMKKLD